MSVMAGKRSLSDRTLNRLIIVAGLVLLVGVPAVAAIYWLDRNVDAGPSLVDRSIATAEEAVRLNPNLLSARLALAGDYLAAKRFTDALTQYNEVLRADAKNKAALMGRGKTQLGLANASAARADFQAVVDAAKDTDLETSDPQVEEALYNLGSLDLKENRPADAVAALEQALTIDRADADASYLLGMAYLQTNQPADAVSALRWAVAFVPMGWCEPYAALTQAYTAANQADGVQYATGMVAFCEGRFADATTALQPLATSATLGKDALLGLGLVAEGQGAMDQALSYYQQVLALDPTDFNAGAGLKRLASAAPASSAAPPPASGSPAAPGSSPSALKGSN